MDAIYSEYEIYVNVGIVMEQRAAYSVKEVLVMVGISRTKFYQVVNAGDLKVRKLGNRTLVLATVLEAWLDGLPELRRR